MTQKTFKYRIYPNKQQKEMLAKHFGAARFVYNWALDKKIKAYQKEDKSFTYFDLSGILTKIKQEKEFEWLNEVNSQSLHMSIRNLDNAFTRFFRLKKSFPKFKNRKSKQSFHCPQHSNIDFYNNKISVPKIPNIKAKIDREFNGKIKTVTISKTCTEKYYASILVESPKTLPEKPKIKEQTTLGIDLGINHFATFSNGVKIENPKYLKKSLNKLKTLSEGVSRKKLGSNNRNKARLKLALLYEKITNQRGDFLHKLTYKLTHENQVESIALEDLNISGMVKNKHLSQAISDASWSQFINQLEYKSEWYGKNLIFIGRFDPSSKICSCGTINNSLTLKDRTWTCNSCNKTHDRDILAANNIKSFALQKQNLIGLEQPELTLGESKASKVAC